MKLRVVSIASGGEFTDSRRRLTLALVRADKRYEPFDRLQMSEKEIGIVGLKLDDEIDIAFGCDAVAIREQRKLALAREEGEAVR